MVAVSCRVLGMCLWSMLCVVVCRCAFYVYVWCVCVVHVASLSCVRGVLWCVVVCCGVVLCWAVFRCVLSWVAVFCVVYVVSMRCVVV